MEGLKYFPACRKTLEITDFRSIIGVLTLGKEYENGKIKRYSKANQKGNPSIHLRRKPTGQAPNTYGRVAQSVFLIRYFYN